MTRFLSAKNHRPFKIYRRLCDVYGNNVMSEGRVCQWCIRFKNGQTNVQDEEKSGRPSVVNDCNWLHMSIKRFVKTTVSQ